MPPETPDIRGLWNEFEHFGPREYIGVAVEQAPTYQEARALGGLNFNGGVQLLALQKMRASTEYAALMKRYAERRWTHMKPGGIGWLGDQTLYSWMSVNGSGAQHIFHVLPCGWNRQIGTHMAGWKGFWEAHRCPMERSPPPTPPRASGCQLSPRCCPRRRCQRPEAQASGPPSVAVKRSRDE